ncbi:MAG: dihydroneopterin aldolase [Bacteroidaceae bacterium]|nr:dihydroneopterin aldolase [Bacteroidaceae bacterium]
MNTFICLDKMKFYAYHGVSEQEQKVGNNYEVTLKISAPVQAAMDSDSLSHTINYADLYELVKTEMDIPSLLIEHVAGRIVKQLQQNYPQITSLVLKVTKMHPPISGEVESASFEVSY